eukprot:9476192-Pyramimonas_sp.AAC.2
MCDTSSTTPCGCTAVRANSSCSRDATSRPFGSSGKVGASSGCPPRRGPSSASRQADSGAPSPGRMEACCAQLRTSASPGLALAPMSPATKAGRESRSRLAISSPR